MTQGKQTPSKSKKKTTYGQAMAAFNCGKTLGPYAVCFVVLCANSIQHL